jgi:flagellar biosynthetic protein FlhB
MASDDSDKSEEPTAKKKKDAIDKGQIGRSQDLSSAVILLTGLCALALFGGKFVNTLMGLMRDLLGGSYLHWQPSAINLSNFAMYLLQTMIYMLMPILLMLLVVGLIGNIAQVGIHFTTKTLEPKLSKVFSLKNFTRLFGSQAWVELIKGILKMAVVGYISYHVIRERFDDILYVADMQLGVFVSFLLDIIVEVLIKVIIFLLILGIVDLIYQKRKTHNELKMTKQDVRDEHKNAKGDPKIQAARRKAMLKLHQQFMMKELPSATVVITNPTHLAIALRYERGKDQVPLIIAKGADKLAERIKEIAREHDIPLYENVPLARAMYDAVEVGAPLPAEFFSGVAEVLAYVFRSQPQPVGAA